MGARDLGPLPRRRFIHAAGATVGLVVLVSAWPARGQSQAPRSLRIGVLGIAKPPGDGSGLRDALAPYGYVLGKNLEFETRWADGDAQRLPALAAELVQSKVDVILVSITPEAQAAKKATATIPILMMGVGGDPVASGLVASLAKPGGNITGLISMTAEQGVKRLELLKELLPRLSKAAWLSGSQTTEATRKALHAAAAAMRIDLVAVEVRSEPDITTAIASMRPKGIQALTMIPTTLLRNHATLIAELALQNGLPFAGAEGDAERGALLGLTADTSQRNPRVAYLIDRIARGTKPADLPIEQPTRFTLSVNLKTARALGVKLSPGFMVRVDRTIE